MVGLTRLELVTSRLSGVRSNQLSYRPICERLILSKLNSTSIADVRPDLQWNFFHRCLLRKEVIQPHLPIRLPCYDFTPIIGSTLDGWLLAVTPPASGVSNSHSVTGGVYKARERIHRGMLTRDY